MKVMAAILAAGITLSILGGPPVLAEGDQAGTTFELKRQPLPNPDWMWFGYWSARFKPLETVPSGVEGVKAASATLRMGPKSQEQRMLVLAGFAKNKARYDRLYVDANGDSRFEPDECYDISRSGGAVEIKSRRGRHHIGPIIVQPVKLLGVGGSSQPPRWILCELSAPIPGSSVLWTPLTCAMGQVTFGDKRMRLAVYDGRHDSDGRFDRGVEFPDPKAPPRQRYIRRNCQLLLDRNGNGRFDLTRLSRAGPENRPMTRLCRVDGRFYELSVAQDGSQVRVAPANPKLCTVALAKSVESGLLIGPDFACCLNSKDKRVEIPAGRYIALQYWYRAPGGILQVEDWREKAPVEVQPGRVCSLRLGPPFDMRITSSLSRDKNGGGSPWKLSLGLASQDCAGRPVRRTTTADGGRPKAPRFKLVDAKGKTVLDDAFKYG